MKIMLIIVLVFSQSCISIRTVSPSETPTTKIIDGRAKGLKKLKLPSCNLLVLDNPDKTIHFRSFLSNKYGLDNYLLTDKIIVKIEGTEFEMQVHTPDYTSHSVNLIAMTINKAIDKNDTSNITDYHETQGHDYIAISLYYNDEDCLGINSIFYNLATNYLQNLTDEYLLYE